MYTHEIESKSFSDEWKKKERKSVSEANLVGVSN